MKRVLTVAFLALVTSVTFAAVELYEMPDGTMLEVMHPGVDGVTRPMARSDAAVQPAYPQLPRALSEDSSVVLAVLVDRSGDALVADVLESSHPGLGFEDAAADAVFKWKFDPAALDGDAVISYTRVRMTFPRSGGGGARGGLVGSMVPGGSPNRGDTNFGREAAMRGQLPNKGEAALPDAKSSADPDLSGHQEAPRLQRGSGFDLPPEGQLYFRGHPEWGYKLYGGEPSNPDAPWR